MNNLSIRLFMTAALVCGIFFLTSCAGDVAKTTTPNKPADAPKNDAPKNDAPKTDAPKSDVASTDSVGVPECDEYIKKYEACLTKIAEKAPQAQPSLKSSFEQTRSSFKQGASTEQGKAMLATQCKQLIETSKQSTATYGCAW